MLQCLCGGVAAFGLSLLPLPRWPIDHRYSDTFDFRQSSGEKHALAEPGLPAKSSARKSDSRLPAIDQTSVKHKHKSTMTPKKSENAGPSKPSPGEWRVY